MKKPFIYLLTAGLAFSMISNTSVTYAADFQENNEIPQSKNSEATVTFTAPETPVAPLNPDKPDENLNESDEDIDGEKTGFSGPLSLDFVSNINFNEEDNALQIESKTKKYETTSKKPFIQVSDLRGEGTGWHVTAQASRFTESGENTLKGSTISFINGTAISPSVSKKPYVNPGIDLATGGDSQLVVNAKPKVAEEELENAEGLGTWLFSWYDVEGQEEENASEIILEVPGGTASSGEHTATINWTLFDGPTSESSSKDEDTEG